MDVFLSQQGIYFLFSRILQRNLLGTLRCAGIGKIPDWLIVLANNIDNLVVVLVSQAVGLNPDHISIANQVCIGGSLPVNEAHLWELLSDFTEP